MIAPLTGLFTSHPAHFRTVLDCPVGQGAWKHLGLELACEKWWDYSSPKFLFSNNNNHSCDLKQSCKRISKIYCGWKEEKGPGHLPLGPPTLADGRWIPSCLYHRAAPGDTAVLWHWEHLWLTFPPLLWQQNEAQELWIPTNNRETSKESYVKV